MAEIINGLNKIEQITLGEAVFGNGLNERLEQIDDNFQSIITSEYLKGDSGASFGYATFSRKLVRDKNGNIIYEENNRPKYNIVEPNGIYWGKSELDIDYVSQNIIAAIGAKPEVQNQMEDTLEFEFTFIYEIINGKKNVKSSLPFVYYDPSIYGVSQNLEHEDYSCIVIFDDDFKKLNAFPTIYYNKDDDKFYWKINGIETKLTATGPKGERGPAGGFNIVTIGTNYTLTDNIKEYTIEKFLYQDPEDDTYRFIDISVADEYDRQIAAEILVQDSPCIVLQNTSSEKFIAIGPVNLNGHDSDGNMIYYVRIWDELAISHSINAALLMQIFDQMGPESPLRGLYIPDLIHNGGKHMFYTKGDANNVNDNKILYLRHIDSEGEDLGDSVLDCQALKSNSIVTKVIEARNIYCDWQEQGDFEWVGNIMLTGGMSMKPMPLQMIFTNDKSGNQPDNYIYIDKDNTLTIGCLGAGSQLKFENCVTTGNVALGRANASDFLTIDHAYLELKSSYINGGAYFYGPFKLGSGQLNSPLYTRSKFSGGAIFTRETVENEIANGPFDIGGSKFTGDFGIEDSTVNINNLIIKNSQTGTESLCVNIPTKYYDDYIRFSNPRYIHSIIDGEFDFLYYNANHNIPSNFVYVIYNNKIFVMSWNDSVVGKNTYKGYQSYLDGNVDGNFLLYFNFLGCEKIYKNGMPGYQPNGSVLSTIDTSKFELIPGCIYVIMELASEEYMPGNNYMLYTTDNGNFTELRSNVPLSTPII